MKSCTTTIFLCLCLSLTSFTQPKLTGKINSYGMVVQTRFHEPAGYVRKVVDTASFAFYLRNVPLKPVGAKVKYFDGTVKEEDVYEAVVNMDLENRDLQQCADVIMRLRAEYLYKRKEYDKITFNFTNGFKVDYSRWIKGERIKVHGNEVKWVKSEQPGNTYKIFRSYMDVIFEYCGTLSLSKMLKHKNIKDMEIGDVFVHGGSPGHAVIVMDMAVMADGSKVFLLAQGYMPAQDTQILKNPNDANLSPWYSSDITGQLITPQLTFSSVELMGWE